MTNGPKNHEVPHPRDEVEVINVRGAEAGRMAAQLLCRETIEMAYDSIAVHLQADKDQHEELGDAGYPQGEMVGYFVLQDKFTAPQKQGQYVRTFSTKIEPSERNHAQDYMKLHVPVGDIRIQTYEMPPQSEVEEVYVELHEGDDTHWYAINKEGLYEYIPALRQDEEGEAVLTDQGIWQWLNERLPENVETITGLFRKVVNWNTMPQRVDRIGDL